MKEFNLIEKYFKPLTKNAAKTAQELGDDVAKISLISQKELVISKDVFVEDIHFLKSDGAFKIASKLLRTNLSDLASSGAKPLYYMLGFCKNSQLGEEFVSDFCAGLKSVQKEFDVHLIGGDTVKSKKLFFSITIFGEVSKDKNLQRKNAAINDLIFVSGSIGDAFLGLNKVQNKFLQNRHFFPNPRLVLGQELLKRNLSKCAIDVSDGLIADLNHICHASKLSAEIFVEKIPLSKPAKTVLKNHSKFSITDLITAGDDYELIFTVPEKNLKKIAQLSEELKLDLTCIGTMKKAVQNDFSCRLIDAKGNLIKLKKTGYEH